MNQNSLKTNEDCDRTALTSASVAKYSTIEIGKIKQAGDNFLLCFNYPACHEDLFDGYPLQYCSRCKHGFENYILALPNRIDLITGTRRKRVISKKLVRAIYEAQAGSCLYCYKSLEGIRYHVDHIFPLCAGGINKKSNLCVTCPECNMIAGGKAFNSLNAKKNYILSHIKKRRGQDL